MKTFFIFILLFIIAYYLIKAVLKILFSFFPGNKKTGFSNFNNNNGKIKFEMTNEKKKRFSKNIGEYTDYEEIKK
jgi:hypothetical protein